MTTMTEKFINDSELTKILSTLSNLRGFYIY